MEASRSGRTAVWTWAPSRSAWTYLATALAVGGCGPGEFTDFAGDIRTFPSDGGGAVRDAAADGGANEGSDAALMNPPDGRCEGLLFASGFEQGVTVARRTSHTDSLGGMDSTTQFDWGQDLPAEASDGASFFNYLVRSDIDRSSLSDYVETRIETVIGHGGSPTRALYQRVHNNDATTPATSRNQFEWELDDGAHRLYVRYWIKFQDDLRDAVRDGWRNVMEWRARDYRWALYIYGNSQSELSWHVRPQFGLSGNSPDDTSWPDAESDVRVPIGKWFLLEAYWEEHATDGRMFFAIDGKTLLDHRGRTRDDSRVADWHVFKVYTNGWRRGHSQWIDDVVICEGMRE